MTFDREAFLARFWKMDAALVSKGFPPISDWWRAEIERFIRGGKRRWIVRAGRRAGKSTTLSRLAVAWAWFGPWVVPPGDTAVVPFVSVSKDEASARLKTIADILKALGLASDRKGDEIELRGARAVTFKVVACNSTAVVGFTSIAVFADEVARWESRDGMANPAKEVIGSLAPTLATQPLGFMVAGSSPWGEDDYHAERFDQGEDATQTVSYAPTWVANPTISEERTHELEPDDRTWQREYAALPGATVTAALDREDVEASFGRVQVGKPSGGFIASDASSLRGDAFSYIGGHRTDAGEIVVCEVSGWEGDDLKRVQMGEIVATIAERAKLYGASVFGDQREEASLKSLFGQHHVNFTSFAWSERSKDEAIQLVRRWMREGKLILPEHATLRRELLGMKARLVPSGRTHYSTNGLDYASALVTLAHAEMVGGGDHEYHQAMGRISKFTDEEWSKNVYSLFRLAGGSADE